MEEEKREREETREGEEKREREREERGGREQRFKSRDAQVQLGAPYHLRVGAARVERQREDAVRARRRLA